MDQRQHSLDQAVAAGDVPFVVGMTATGAGAVWIGAAGQAREGMAAGPDTVFRIFSMTKAVGVTAALILVERGRVTLDTPVADILPAFRDIGLLDGWDGDTPRLRAPQTPVTLRHLATHTSGLAYEYWNADMSAYMKATGLRPIGSGKLAAMAYPLMFEPGTRWDYGIGIDWLGRVVEGVDGRRIDDFVTAEILGPLGMTDTGFEVAPHMAARLSQPWARGADGVFAPITRAPPSQPEFYGMGHALYSTPQDYLRFLRMYLGGGSLDGTRILRAKTVAMAMQNHIGEVSAERLVTVAPQVSADFDPFPDQRTTHSLPFMRIEADVPGRRAAGSQFWAGVLNTHYWIDPQRDLAAVLMTQSLPFVEPRFMQTYESFERAVYAA